MAQYLQNYLQFISDTATTPSLSTQWTCALSNVPQKIIENMDLANYERESWGNNTDALNGLRDKILQQYVTGSENHFMYVVASKTPEEESEPEPLNNFYYNGGYIMPNMIRRRKLSNTGILELEIIETDYSFIDFLLRPWAIIVSYEGLIAQEDTIKANSMSLYQYDRSGNVRKEFVFYNICPMSCPSMELSHRNEKLQTVKTKWVYTHYIVRTGNSSFSNAPSNELPNENNKSSGGLLGLVSSITKPLRNASNIVGNLF